MRIIPRQLANRLKAAAKQFPSVIVTGPRRAGKTFLLQQTFPRASYQLLEDPDVLARIKADPRGWLDELKPPVIIDEIQNAPELFSYIRTRIDRQPNRYGRWLLTGSQDFSLMAQVSETMTGRAAVFGLSPLSFRETGSWRLTRGGFPEVILQPRRRRIWFRSYVQTYLERDVRSLKAVKDLMTFRRFLALLASRNGQILNKTDMAAPLGVSVPTITEWLSVLQTTGHILLVPPFFENLGKRLIKSPKIYWIDSGLVCFLLGIETERQLKGSPFIGSVFEGFIASEIVKNQLNQGKESKLFFFRDQQGLEVDFLAPGSGGRFRLIEVKWSKTIMPDIARPLKNLRRAFGKRQVDCLIVHRASESEPETKAVMPGVQVFSVEEFLKRFP
jgi:predicted AAA+ superfamily ATPase